ncbi:MAG TPA: hypothetical protein VG900_03685 [Hyphomicrobiaceae bacterium]|jgi:hypothetical protein|nr:hypothetical protein [Hyphomicrobiaceae bacterium]
MDEVHDFRLVAARRLLWDTHHYFHANRQGSVIAMSDDSGAKVEGPYVYDPCGNGAPTTGEPYKFTGRRLDPETGLYY